MTDARPLIAATVAATVLYLASALSLPQVPDAGDPGSEVVRYFVDSGDQVKLSLFLGLFALVALMVAIALMRERLPKPVSTVFLVGGIVTVTASMLTAWFSAGLALNAGSLNPDVARTVLNIVSFYGPFLTASTMVMIGASMVGARKLGLPAWYVIIAAVVFVEQFVETATVFGTDGFTEPGGAMNLQLGAGLFIVWFVSTGFVLALRAPMSSADSASRNG
jgi:hypothetical protein